MAKNTVWNILSLGWTLWRELYSVYVFTRCRRCTVHEKSRQSLVRCTTYHRPTELNKKPICIFTYSLFILFIFFPHLVFHYFVSEMKICWLGFNTQARIQAIHTISSKIESFAYFLLNGRHYFLVKRKNYQFRALRMNAAITSFPLKLAGANA